MARGQKTRMRSNSITNAIALGAVAAAGLFHWVFGSLLSNTLPLVTLFAAIGLAVWVGGYRAGLVAMLLGLLVCAGLILWPGSASVFEWRRSSIDFVAYLLTSLVIIGLGEHLHGVRRRLEEQRNAADVALKSAKEGELRFRRLADSAPVLIWESGPDGGFTWLNKQWLDFVGRPMERELGNGWTDNVHPEDLPNCLRVYKTAFAARQPFSLECRLRDRSGEYRWVLDRGIPLYGLQGEFGGYLGTVLDIDDHKSVEQTLKEADRRKDEFLATLSHELRNPLAPIRNAVEVFKRKALPDADLNDGRQIIERQVDHMSRLLEDLLDLSRISHDKLVLRKQRIDIGPVLREAIETSRALPGGANRSVSVALHPDVLYVSADPVRLSQVFCNLVDNAQKYSDPATPIQISVRLRGDEAVVSIRDHGIGIEAHRLEDVFVMFSQLVPAMERTRGGLGIGLALARHIVRLHGGNLEARSEGLGQGSEFIVSLPLAQRDAAVVQSEPAMENRKPENKAGHRVLVVDDSEDSADSLALMLSLSGHETRTAYDGEAAIETASSFLPDVILMDVGMPGVTGIDACRRIRATPWGKEIYVLALTGWGQDADRQRTSEAGFDAHLVKPVDPALLMTTLSSYRGKRGTD